MGWGEYKRGGKVPDGLPPPPPRSAPSPPAPPPRTQRPNPSVPEREPVSAWAEFHAALVHLGEALRAALAGRWWRAD